MPSAKDLALELAAEFGRRNIDARVSDGSTEYACDATINNMPVSVYFTTDPNRGDIRWQSNTEVHRIPNRDITADDLAEQIIDTYLNPA
jgi:hypothetical protein